MKAFQCLVCFLLFIIIEFIILEMFILLFDPEFMLFPDMIPALIKKYRPFDISLVVQLYPTNNKKNNSDCIYM